jgi:hypothetical protein
MDGMQHGFAAPSGLALATVINDVDPQSRGRLQISLAGSTAMLFWAACIVPSSGQGSAGNYGVAMLPKIGEIVVVAFLTPDQAFVIGAVWSGQSTFPRAASPTGERYAVTTPQQTSMVFDDTGPAFSVTTPASNAITLTDSGGGTCTIQVGSTNILATSTSVSITTSAAIEIDTAALTVNAPSVAVNAAMAQFSGAIQCDSIIANTVIGASYTPGAGNIW